MAELGLFFETRYWHIAKCITHQLYPLDVIALSLAFSPKWPSMVSGNMRDFVWCYVDFWLYHFVYPGIGAEARRLWNVIVTNLPSTSLNTQLIGVIIEELQCVANDPIWIRDDHKRATIYAHFLDCPIQALIRHQDKFGGNILLHLCQHLNVYEMLQLFKKYRLPNLNSFY